MKSIETHGSFEETLHGSSEHVGNIARGLRQLIVELYPQVVEVPWPKQNIIGFGVGPKKMSEHFCYVGVFKGHVNLGFYHGVNLTDPKGLLEGSGKKLRHMKIAELDQLSQPAVAELISDAILERVQALGLE